VGNLVAERIGWGASWSWGWYRPNNAGEFAGGGGAIFPSLAKRIPGGRRSFRPGWPVPTHFNSGAIQSILPVVGILPPALSDQTRRW
jgi:hypothetical protein